MEASDSLWLCRGTATGQRKMGSIYWVDIISTERVLLIASFTENSELGPFLAGPPTLQEPVKVVTSMNHQAALPLFFLESLCPPLRGLRS